MCIKESNEELVSTLNLIGIVERLDTVDTSQQEVSRATGGWGGEDTEYARIIQFSKRHLALLKRGINNKKHGKSASVPGQSVQLQMSQ